MEKLLSAKCAPKFNSVKNQKKLGVDLTKSFLDNFAELEVCVNGHTSELLLKYVLSSAVNTVLNNYCKEPNDNISQAKSAASQTRKYALFKKQQLQRQKTLHDLLHLPGFVLPRHKASKSWPTP